jgi:hypothetical protein
VFGDDPDVGNAGPFVNSTERFQSSGPNNLRAYGNEANAADENLRLQVPSLQGEAQALLSPDGVASSYLRDNAGDVDGAIRSLRDNIEWRRGRASAQPTSTLHQDYLDAVAREEAAVRLLERRPRVVADRTPNAPARGERP